jgi:diguanylate cyclase (GGDEF)-like protein
LATTGESNAASLGREITLIMERLQRHKHERHWSLLTLMMSVLAAALLTWMVIATQRQRRELLRRASRDPVTGLPNRRYTATLASAALDAASVTRRSVTIAFIDLDHFKSINDRCGNAVGNYVLKEFARRARLRASETLGRWGDGLFLLILPDAKLNAAVATLRHLQAATADIPLPDTARGLKLTFSAGLSSRRSNVLSLNEIIACADAALYEAKQGGRNLWRLDHETYRAAASGVLKSLYGEAGRKTHSDPIESLLSPRYGS